jgi:hypothetical protein
MMENMRLQAENAKLQYEIMKMFGDSAVESKLSQMRGLKDEDTEEEVDRSFAKFELVTDGREDEYRFKALELKVWGRAKIAYKEVKKAKGSYMDFKTKVMKMVGRILVSKV